MKVLETKKGRIDKITIQAKAPNFEDTIFTVKELQGCTLYWGENEGFVQFFADDHNNDMGSAGRVIQVQTEDGERTIHGPWSSRASVMNKYFPQCTEVVVVVDSLCGIATAMTTASLEWLGLIFERVEDERGEIEYKLA